MAEAERTPRQWFQGDPEPPTDVALLYSPKDNLFMRRTPKGWLWVDSPDETVPADQGWRWYTRDTSFLVEVL